MNAKDILDSKGRKIFAVTEDTTVFDAISELANNKIGLLIVKNSAGNISGVLSERDIIQKCIYPKKDPGLLRSRDIMTPKENIVVAAEEDDIQNLMNTMTEKRIRHLPIFKGQELAGIISIGDIVKSMLEIKDYEIKSLIDYISGHYPR
jgi:CBS domain-containing protein